MGFKTALPITTIVLLSTRVGCQAMESTSKPTMADKSPYDRLGGKPAITNVVEDFVGRVATDHHISGKFTNIDTPRWKTLLVKQRCQAPGSSCTYTARSIKAIHAGMGVTSADFDALVGDLTVTLNTFKMPEREKNELLSALSSMKKDFVEKPQTSMY